VPWAIRSPLNKSVASSGNGNPIPPRMRVRIIPTYGKLFMKLSIFTIMSQQSNVSGIELRR
jgi:hypothetical protein